jgi:hypothetical protein
MLAHNFTAARLLAGQANRRRSDVSDDVVGFSSIEVQVDRGRERGAVARPLSKHFTRPATPSVTKMSVVEPVIAGSR